MIPDPVLRREWFAVARASDVAGKAPLGVEALGQKVVLWRSEEGIVAWEDLCVHRGAQLSLGRVDHGCLRCPYHGWTYDGLGRCVTMPAHPGQPPPARARATVLGCREAYGWVWIAFDQPAAPFPVFPEWKAEGYRYFARGPYRVRAQAPRIVENFLDLAHFAFVHPGLLGDEGRPEIGRYNVTLSDEGVEATDISIWQPDGAGTGQGSMVQYTYRVDRPLCAYLAKIAGDVRITIMLTTTPIDERTTIAWLATAIRNADFIPDAALAEYIDQIFLQDVPIVESQRPELLPLDLQAELHLPSDRTSIAYRQWLKRTGLAYGIA